MTNLQQRVVPFYGDELVAVQQPDGAIYALFSRLCENLGLNRRGQVQRVQRHPVMRQGLVTLTVQTAGGPQALQCLRLDMLPGWLFGVQVGQVKEEIRPKLERYQAECFEVLWSAFKQEILPEASPTIRSLQQIAEMGRAIAALADQQIELEQKQQTLASRVDKAAVVVRDMQVRLGVLEEKLQPAAYIADQQAAEVSSQVKALAELLTQKDASKNQYQAIFAELYRRFGVSSYKLIRQGQYEAVLHFLEDWRASASRAD